MIEIINSVIINGIEISTTRPLEVEISEFEDDSVYKYIVSTDDEWCEYGLGDTKEEAITDLKKQFDFLYKCYGCSPDCSLMNRAIGFKKDILELIGAGEGSIWIVPVRELLYKDAKKEILDYINSFDRIGVANLVEALWLDIELVSEIVNDIDCEYRFRWN